MGACCVKSSSDSSDGPAKNFHDLDDMKDGGGEQQPTQTKGKTEKKLDRYRSQGQPEGPQEVQSSPVTLEAAPRPAIVQASAPAPSSRLVKAPQSPPAAAAAAEPKPASPAAPPAAAGSKDPTPAASPVEPKAPTPAASPVEQRAPTPAASPVEPKEPTPAASPVAEKKPTPAASPVAASPSAAPGAKHADAADDEAAETAKRAEIRATLDAPAAGWDAVDKEEVEIAFDEESPVIGVEDPAALSSGAEEPKSPAVKELDSEPCAFPSDDWYARVGAVPPQLVRWQQPEVSDPRDGAGYPYVLATIWGGKAPELGFRTYGPIRGHSMLHYRSADGGSVVDAQLSLAGECTGARLLSEPIFVRDLRCAKFGADVKLELLRLIGEAGKDVRVLPSVQGSDATQVRVLGPALEAERWGADSTNEKLEALRAEREAVLELLRQPSWPSEALKLTVAEPTGQEVQDRNGVTVQLTTVGRDVWPAGKLIGRVDGADWKRESVSWIKFVTCAEWELESDDED
eukprot:TRINITY_DN35873_c0_g1_i1.p1 TRINITY_DN35873_c0_g1~~TRINITY_DN35873_c0_g1_i1.p1  ORF type:complete len:515 (+),score=106.29 TRINITY_DN35873_c0_g1_i1:186-1730(+)